MNRRHMADFLRRHVGIVAQQRPFAWRTARELERRTAIVYAHHVGAPAAHFAVVGGSLTLEQLDERLSTLARRSEFVPLAEVLADGSGRRLAVTFDDGFDLVASGALDVLAAHGVKATTFVLTAMLGNRGLMWRNKLSAVCSLRPPQTCVHAYNHVMDRVGLPRIGDVSELLGAAMAWDMARKDELADALWSGCDMPPLPEYLDAHRPYLTDENAARWLAEGHTIGLHTATHPDCSRLDAEGVRAEILEPARALCARLGCASVTLSYPFGRRCLPVHEHLLRDSGVIDCALGIRGLSPPGTDRFRLERASIEGEMRFSVYGKALLGVPRAT
jgi:peptidoglycan/xylan/chitin deacetylase (PgdA/CDA1 family)